MNKKFNLAAYQRLRQLKDNGKIVSLDETFFEFVDYESSVESQISYNRKKEYFLLIHKYLTLIIDRYDFQSKLSEMQEEDILKARRILDNFQELEVFSLAEDLTKFSDPIDEISQVCFDADEMWDESVKTRTMPEERVYSLINNYYIQLKKAFPVEIWEVSNKKL